MDPAYTGGERPLRRVVVVNGYGCNLDAPLMPYLNEVVAFIREHDVRHAIFTGGFTQRKLFPGKSEAAVMRDYVRSCLPADWGLVAYTDEDSYTTHENAVKAAAILRRHRRNLWNGWPPRPGELTIFCEAQRALKVLMCYWVLLPEYRPSAYLHLTVRTVSWERANPLLELIKGFNEVVALYVPLWGRWMRNSRIAAYKKR